MTLSPGDEVEVVGGPLHGLIAKVEEVMKAYPREEPFIVADGYVFDHRELEKSKIGFETDRARTFYNAIRGLGRNERRERTS